MVITQPVFQASLHCPTKSYLLARNEPPTSTMFKQVRDELNVGHVENAAARLQQLYSASAVSIANVPENPVPGTNSHLALDCTITTSDIEAHLHAIEVADGRRKNKLAGYTPVRFIPDEKISPVDKLLLTFHGLALARANGGKPQIGKIIHGRDFRTTTVSLTKQYAKVQAALTRIAVQNESATPPPLVLNKHCGECEYHLRCFSIAKNADDLSLLAKITQKEQEKYHGKGIFTVTQLSYTYRPRRRPNRIVKYDHALKALAIRKNQVHVVGYPASVASGTPVYLDVEGDPDRDFYYCVGLRCEIGGCIVQRAFWADEASDERVIWMDCLRTLGSIDSPQLIHYGSYETTFVRQMMKRYGAGAQTSLVESLLASGRNLLADIYAKVYFPTYSNSLKEIAGYLGFQWSDPAASGMLAILRRRQWERSRDPQLKGALLRYNADDCAAAQLISEALAGLAEPSTPDSQVVDVSTLKREYPQHFGKTTFALPEFEQINNAAYWDYQRDRVHVRSNSRPGQRRRTANVNRPPVPINKTIVSPEVRPAHCHECHSPKIYKYGRMFQVVYDLKLSGAGVKRWVVRHQYNRYICWHCKSTFHQHVRLDKYGAGFQAYVVYQIIDLQLPQHAVAKSMRQLFTLPLSGGMINHVKKGVAARYEATYDAILKQIINGELVHADETRVSVLGKPGYVWVFTNREDVAFVYSETREGSTARDLLRNFKGVLVSDFYTGYDCIPCRQQKCLIHLIRDMNDSLSKEPFNEELKQMAWKFGDLLKLIVDSVDRWGLQSRHLRKHQAAVERFYGGITRAAFETETAIACRRRFEKNRERLFTFLENDGVPWNNNNAEHAIKSLARLRNVMSGKTTVKGLRDYLILLSISETCKYRNLSFLDFLLSGQKDVVAFAENHNRHA